MGSTLSQANSTSKRKQSFRTKSRSSKASKQHGKPRSVSEPGASSKFLEPASSPQPKEPPKVIEPASTPKSNEQSDGKNELPTLKGKNPIPKDKQKTDRHKSDKHKSDRQEEAIADKRIAQQGENEPQEKISNKAAQGENRIKNMTGT